MVSVTDNAIILRRWEWSETSQVVALFLRAHGVVRGLAKGARRERAPFSGGFEPLTMGGVVVYPRRNSTLATLAEWDLQRVFWGPRRSLRAHYTGLYAADLAMHMMAEDDPHPALWDALVDTLDNLSGAQDDALALLRFQWCALVESGHRLDLTEPGRVGRSGALGLDLEAGRLMPDPGAGSRASSSWRVRKDTVALLRHIDQPAIGPRTSENGASTQLAVVDRANRLLCAYCARIAGRMPPSASPALGMEKEPVG